jgi:hypothetical protein
MKSRPFGWSPRTSSGGGRGRRLFHGGYAAVLLAALVGGAIAREPAAVPQTLAEAVLVSRGLAAATPAQGHAGLAAAADRVAVIPADWILPCLEAFREATPAGANWLRSGLERAFATAGGAVKADELVAAVTNTALPPRARSLAYTWLKLRDRDRAEAVIGGLLDDVALDLRREAVEKLLASTAGGDDAARKATHRQALAAARDVDQIEQIAGWLAEHGDTIDLAGVMGFVRRWRVSGEFDNVKGIGFAKAYPPEETPARPDVAAWKQVDSADKHGAIDLNTAVATKKGVLAYAVAEIEMPRAGPAEVRIGSPCAVAVWVNGKQVMSHEIYHASEAIDQYVAAAEFRAGRNTVLVKCCQNEQTESWAADWKFQLRICDPLGTPLATQTGGNDDDTVR